MKRFGLIGKKLGHSFSKKYFTEKFQREGIVDCQYELFELATLEEFPDFIQNEKGLYGLNVTIPYKQEVIPYLDVLSPQAEKIGAVNVIQFKEGKRIGHNSDYIGFKDSLVEFLAGATVKNALMLGTGGASKAVKVALAELGMNVQIVSRKAGNGILSYQDLTDAIIKEHMLIVNTTPLGMYPEVNAFPLLPYEAMGEDHFCYDLVYNPETTAFMKKAAENGANVINGLPMLIGQAEAGWEIWNEK